MYNVTVSNKEPKADTRTWEKINAFLPVIVDSIVSSTTFFAKTGVGRPVMKDTANRAITLDRPEWYSPESMAGILFRYMRPDEQLITQAVIRDSKDNGYEGVVKSTRPVPTHIMCNHASTLTPYIVVEGPSRSCVGRPVMRYMDGTCIYLDTRTHDRREDVESYVVRQLTNTEQIIIESK